MKKKALFAGLLITALALAPSAWAHEGEEHGMEHKAPAKAEKAKKHEKKSKKAKADKHATAKEHWVCPMHDGGEGEHAGKCPKCGMDMVKEVPVTKEEKK